VIMTNAIEFENIDVIFGHRQAESLALLDAGKTRSEIAEANNNVLGVAGVNLNVPQGEICVLMGLSGSGKSSLLRWCERPSYRITWFASCAGWRLDGSRHQV